MKHIDSVHFSGNYLIPFYGARNETQFLTTYTGQLRNGSWTINVWAVKAERGNEEKSMAQAIAREEKNYIYASIVKPNSPHISNLKHGVALMKKLSEQLTAPVYHKTPAESFVRQVNIDLARASLRDIDTKKAILLAGINYISER